MRTDFTTLKIEQPKPGLALITLNRPEVRNAFNTQMGRDIRDVFVPLRYTPEDLRCVIVTGSGDKAFCAGGDLKERQGMSDETWRLQHAIFEEGFHAILDCPVPTIAAVNGAAFAGGCELALCCDFVYAVKSARFALTEVSLGIMPGAGGTQLLPRAVGERRAKELILTASPFSAEEAYDWGMVNKLCEPEELMPSVMAAAQRICDNAPISVRQAKRAIHWGLQTDLRSGIRLELEAYEKMIPTEDRREGMNAFNEKRKPVYRGK